MGMIKNRQMWL